VNPGRWLRRGALALAFFTFLPALAPAQESDDATRRARARDEWYNETYAAPAKDKRAKKGGRDSTLVRSATFGRGFWELLP
jgi:hypothetical protein